jgi:MinD-like ATPase involved in chromosome partitioning or flagellar assembly
VSVPLLTAVAGPWEAPLVTGLDGAPGGVHVVRRCADLAELLAAGGAGLARAAVVSSDLHRLDREAVARLHGVGVGVVGLADPADPGAVERLRALGVDRVLGADCDVGDVVDAVLEAVRGAGSGALGGPGPGAVTPASAAAAGGGVAGATAAAAVHPRKRRRGVVVAVWGPAGAPGRTTVAVTVAAELAAAGRSTLLVDADTYGPSVAQALALLEEPGGLAGAVRAALLGSLDLERLARSAPLVSEGLRVLTGLPHPHRWPELRPSGLDVVWARARELSDVTVVDCGFGLETDEELSFDTTAPQRNAATLSALVTADLVLAVGAAEPVGLQRLVRGLHDLDAVLGPDRPRPRIVVTRVRSSAVGPQPHRRVLDALQRYADLDDARLDGVVLVPDDRPACDEAMLCGRALTEQAPASPARLALRELSARVERDLLPARPGGTPAAAARSAGRGGAVRRIARALGRPARVGAFRTGP